MNRNSINNLKNHLLAKELLTIDQKLNIKGGGGDDDEDKRRDGCRGTGAGTVTIDPKVTTTPPVKPGV